MPICQLLNHSPVNTYLITKPKTGRGSGLMALGSLIIEYGLAVKLRH